MTYVSFLGGLLTTFTLPAMLLFMSVAKHPYLILIYLFGAFFWIAGALVKASLWMAYQDSAAATVAVGVLVDGGFRFLFAFTFQKLRSKLLLLLDAPSRGDMKRVLNYRSAALAGGLGYGTIQAITLYGLVLSESTGPATYYLASCPGASIFLLQGVVSLFFLIMAPFLQYAVNHALYHKKWAHLAVAVVIHATSASFTAASTSTTTAGLCGLSVLGAAVGAIASVLYAVYVLHGKGSARINRSASAKLL